MNHSENDQDGNVGSGDENGSVDGENEGSGDENGSVDGENEGSGDENGSVDGENEGSGDENGSVDGENEGSGDENGSVDGENEESGDENGSVDGENEGNGDENGSTDGDDAADEEADAEGEEDAADGEETAEGEETADDDKIYIDKKADSLTAQTTETVMQGTFTDLEVRIGRYQVTQIYGYYTPTNAGVTSKDQLKIVLEQLNSQGTVLATEDIYFYKSGEKYCFYDYSGVVLKDQTAQVRIKVTETVDGTATDYVSETFTRSISSKTPVFTMTQNGEAGVNRVSYNWSVKDYQSSGTYTSEDFKLQFTYYEEDSSTSQTENDTISVYADNSGTVPSGTVTLENLAENTTYTISAKIYIADDAGTDVFAQTITLPEFTTGMEATYTFATIIPDATLRSEIASRVSGLSAAAETVTKSQLEKVTYLSASRYKSSDAAVKSLEGIEYLTNLENLYLNNHELTDISNVNWSSLKKLETLSLTGNDISKPVDLSGMSGLKNLFLNENILKAEAVASIKAKLPASCTYATFDGQRTEGVVLLAESVYYQVNGKSPIFVKIKGLKSGLNDHEISFQVDGTPVTFQKKSYDYDYYLADSGLTVGDTSHTIKATVNGVAKEASFQIKTDDPVKLIDVITCGTDWNYESATFIMTTDDKSVTDIKVTDASGKVYGEKIGISDNSTGYDARYQIVGDGYDLYVGDVYQLNNYYCSVKSIYNRTPAGNYDLVVTYGDGTDQTFKDAFRVLGADKAYITDIWSASGYDNTNDYLYLTINGENVDFSKLNYKVTDSKGVERTLSYVSAKRCNYAGNETSSVVKLKKTDWKPKAGDSVNVKLTAKDGYQIEILDDTGYCYLQSGVFYAELNNVTNSIEVAVTQDMEISNIRVELKKCKDYDDEDGEEFLSGETDQISQGIASVPLTDSDGKPGSLLYGLNYYRINVYLNGSNTPDYSAGISDGNYYSTSSASYWSGGSYYLIQGTKNVKYYYNMLGYDTYKDATFRAELLDSKNVVQKTWSNLTKSNSGNYLKLLVADSTDFCNLTPGYYYLRLYYKTAAMETESYRSYGINILEANKFLVSSTDGNWIEDDTIQLNIYTANAADAKKLKVQVYDKDGTELNGITTTVARTSGNSVYLNLKVKNLTYENARKGYYFKVTHPTYGEPYEIWDNATAYYTDEKGSYESLYYYALYSTGIDRKTVGIGCKGFKLPVTIAAYLPYDTEVQASFTANSRNSYSDGYSWINFPQSFINQLKDKNRLYDIVVTDSNGRSAVSRNHALGYSGTTAKLTGLTMSPTTMTLAEGTTGKLSVTAKPTNASLPALAWSSSNENVATVDAGGVVTAVSAGTATITVSGGGYSATCKVTVKAQVATPGLYLSIDSPEPEEPIEGKIEVNAKKDVVFLKSSTENASIYYTMDGTDPTTKSTKYNATAGITLIKDTTIKAIAVKNGCVNSEVATFECEIRRVTVTFDAKDGTPAIQTQTLYAGEYLDMSKIVDPKPANEEDIFIDWGDPLWLNPNEPVTDSLIYEAFYRTGPLLEAPEAAYGDDARLPNDTAVTLAVRIRNSYDVDMIGNVAEDARIYYTLDGTAPTEESSVYSGPIVLTKQTAGEDEEEPITLRAVAVGEGYQRSEISTYTYTLLSNEEVDELLGEMDRADIPRGGLSDDLGLWIAGLDENGYTYTGSAIKPSVRVYDGTKLLKEKKDYTISYSNNTNVPDPNSGKQPTITITGKGNYNEKLEFTFDILPKNIEDSDVTSDDLFVMYNGKSQWRIPTIKWGKKTLRNQKDFKMITYPDDNFDYTRVGKYDLQVQGIGNYTGYRAVTETIIDKDTEYPVSKLTVRVKEKKLEYTGRELKAGIEVKKGKTVLVEGTDYELTYRNNKEVGTATVTIKGLHEFVGTKNVTFQITGVPMSKVKLADAKAITNKAYEAGKTEYTQSGYTLTYSYKDANKRSQTDTLVEGTDYTVSYLNNTKVGTAKIVFTGMGKYTGTLTKTFKITQSTEFNADTVKVLYNGTGLTPDTEIPYSKGGVKPEITVKIGNTELVNGTDYKVSYKNNTKVYDSAAKNPKKSSIVISGKGNYKGSVTKEFVISAQDISALNGKMTAADVVWKNKKNNYKTKVVITDLDGKVLKENTDYTLTYYKADGITEIMPNTIIPAPAEDAGSTKIIVEATGKGAYTGGKGGAQTIVTTFHMAKNDFSKVKLVKTKAGEGNIVTTGKIEDQIYTGKEIEPTPQALIAAGLSFKNGKTETFLTADDFTIVGYKNNVKKGTATVILKGAGAYAGQKTLTFKITAKPMEDN